jgi:hypothetical protein
MYDLILPFAINCVKIRKDRHLILGEALILQIGGLIGTDHKQKRGAAAPD